MDNMREDRLRRVGHVMRRVKSEAVRMTMEMNVKESRGRLRPKEVIGCD